MPTSTATAPSTKTPSLATVRAWAIDKGMAVGATGNVPNTIIEAYNKSHRKYPFERAPRRTAASAA